MFFNIFLCLWFDILVWILIWMSWIWNIFAVKLIGLKEFVIKFRIHRVKICGPPNTSLQYIILKKSITWKSFSKKSRLKIASFIHHKTKQTIDMTLSTRSFSTLHVTYKYKREELIKYSPRKRREEKWISPVIYV